MENIVQLHEVATDAEIIAKILNGESALYELLIRRYNPVLYKIARSYAFNHQDAEDLMQEAHVAAFKNLGQFSFRASYKTWASKIMINKCLYKLNHGYFNKELAAGDTILDNNKTQPQLKRNLTPEQVYMNKEFATALEKALEKLSLPYREVFLLREVEGFSVAETADMLQLTAVNVKVRLNRAKAMLQKELERVYPLSSIYEFHLRYCDQMVHRVFQAIKTNDGSKNVRF